MARTKSAYIRAGVNIDTANLIKKAIKLQAATTFLPEVLKGVGFFGSLFELKGYRRPVLISSVDGVGTKLRLSCQMQKYNTVGMDIVNHCVNDIFAGGASPLFFLDYIAMPKLVPEQIEAVISGMARACRENGCALVGGETAEMPGIYKTGEYDLAGFIVGVVEKDKIIDGKTVADGDTVLALASSGLHTNGYSLARKVFNTDKSPSALKQFYPEFNRTLGEELLEPHRSYYTTLKPALPLIKGMAHITGGGLLENLPRILPEGLSVHLRKGGWPVPPVFAVIQRQGHIEEEEMYRVFNMGVGMAVVCSPGEVGKFKRLVKEARVIGEIKRAKGSRAVIIS